MHKFAPPKSMHIPHKIEKKKFDLNVTKQNKQLPLVLGW
jgi:hypothetical protein